jgi:hypothetical protein
VVNGWQCEDLCLQHYRVSVVKDITEYIDFKENIEEAVAGYEGRWPSGLVGHYLTTVNITNKDGMNFDL